MKWPESIKKLLTVFCYGCCLALIVLSGCKKDEDKKTADSGTSTDSTKTDTIIHPPPPPPKTFWIPIEFHDTSGLYTNDTLRFRADYVSSDPHWSGGAFYRDIATGAERNGKLIYLKGDGDMAANTPYTLLKDGGIDSIIIARALPGRNGDPPYWYDPEKILSGDTTYHIQIKY